MIGVLTTIIVTGLVFFEQGLTTSPPQPTRGETLKISYDARVDGVSLTNPQGLAIVYLIQSKDTVVTNAELVDEKNGVWSYSIRIPEDAYFVRFFLEDSLGRVLDDGNRWFNLPVYDAEGVAVPNAHLSAGYAFLFSENPDYKRARSEFKKELELHSWNWEAYKGLWDVEIGSAEFDEALRDELVEDIESLLRTASDSISLLYECAIKTYAVLDESGKARDLLGELAKRSPGEDRLGRAVNVLFVSLASKPSSLIEMEDHFLSEASSDDRETIMYHYYFALTLAFRSKDALEVLERFMTDFPDSDKMPLMAYRHIQSTTQSNTLENARAFEDYLEKYPESPLTGMAAIYVAHYYASKDWNAARAYYERAIEADSLEHRPYNYFAYDCAVEGVDLADGEQAIQNAIGMVSYNYYRKRFSHLSFERRKKVMTRDLAELYDTYGWIRFKQTKYGDAAALIEKAVELLGEESVNSEILEHLGQSYEKADKLDEAVDVYMKILRTDPANRDLRKRALNLFVERGGSKKEFDSILSVATAPKERGLSAPDFTVRDIEEKEINLSSLRGKIVVINFWATWCGPCRKEIPRLNDLVDSFKENHKVVFLAISGEKKKKIEPFVESTKFKYDVCYGGQQASRAYKVMYIPTHVIVDTEGNIYSKHIGFKQGINQLLEEEIREALEESGG